MALYRKYPDAGAGKHAPNMYTKNPRLKAVADDVLTRLRPKSRVLNVGCATGEPVAEMVASAGHEVHGIGISAENIRSVQNEANSPFEQVDLKAYFPAFKFDAVLVELPLSYLSASDIYSFVYRAAEWLWDDGVFLIEVEPVLETPSPQAVYDPVWDSVKLPGKETGKTLMWRSSWLCLLSEAGFRVERETLSPFEQHQEHGTYFITAQKKVKFSLLGPYPHDSSCRTIKRNETMWRDLQSHLAVDGGPETLFNVMKLNTNILNFQGGYEVLKANARPSDAATTATTIPITEHNALPFKARSFDSVFCMSALDQVHNVPRFLEKLVHVTDLAARTARIVLVQAAPDNEFLRLIHAICAPLSADSRAPSHQGRLLHAAIEVLPQMGMGDVSLRRVGSEYRFHGDGAAAAEKRVQAAEKLAGVWYSEDPRFGQMKEALAAQLGRTGEDEVVVRNELAVLVARPTPN